MIHDNDFDEYELYNCAKCGEPISEYQSVHYLELCEACWLEAQDFESTLTTENACEIGQLDTVDYEINSFWGYVYSEDEIEDLCAADFAKLTDEKKRDIIRNYATGGYGYNAEEWLDDLERIRRKEQSNES